MLYIKLQAGCLLISLYFIITYVKETLDKKMTCNRIFDALLLVAPWAIVFDGATAWTVNYMEIVPDWLNLLLHALFFLFMNAVTLIVYLYMIYLMIDLKSKWKYVLTLLPGILSMVGILIFLPDLSFIKGAYTYYSMGISVYICFASVVCHFLAVFILMIIKHRTIEKHKIFNLITMMVIMGIILLAQIVFPELLITSIYPVVVLVGIYVNFENPSMRRIQDYNNEMVTAFATLVENRDNSTGGHIKRTKSYVGIILDGMKRKSEYEAILSKDYIRNVENAAPMHDIGKISTPDKILQKPGKLTDEEYDIMKQHASIGGDIIRETFAEVDEQDYQQIAYEMARHHHEKWNGKGYPDGLKGEEIPLHARIMAIADVFDAVSAKRCYRDAMPVEKCFKIIEEGSGTDFDPKLVKIFLDSKQEVLKVKEHLSE